MSRRTSKNKHLIGTNLYYANKERTYLYYENRVTGKKFYLKGMSEAQAIIYALQANALMPEIQKQMAADHLPNLLDKFVTDYLPLKEYAPRTYQGVITKVNKLKQEFIGKNLQDLTVLSLRDYLEPFSPHSRKHNRLLWIEIYKYAMSEGLVDSNLAERTLTKKIPKRQRDRLTLTQFNTIYSNSPEWFQIAMLACLLTLQRRDDLVNIKFTDFNKGVLSLIQNKTGTGLNITANSDLDALFRRSLRTPTPSPYLVHKNPLRAKKTTKKQHWTQVTPEMLTREFKKQRDLVIKSTATFYEIKSLGGRLLIEQGQNIEFVNALMGHGDMATTQIYLDNGITWKQAEAGLKV